MDTKENIESDLRRKSADVPWNHIYCFHLINTFPSLIMAYLAAQHNSYDVISMNIDGPINQTGNANKLNKMRD